jgi:LmbE family N-acetylglucosaminyl deacetylase
VSDWRGRRLTAVLAHPDDESRIIGGTLALHACRGAHVSLYCATRGEGGDPSQPPEEVAALRERELEAACRALGIGQLHLGRLPDGGLAEADEVAVVADIVRHLRTVRPHVVITFGPDGRTGHPDHIAIGQLAERAFERAGDEAYRGDHELLALTPWRPELLYHCAMADSVARRQGWPFPSFPDDQLVRVDVAEVLDRKRQAVMEAHASQWDLSPWNLSAGWGPRSVEHFRLARSVGSPRPPGAAQFWPPHPSP